MKKNEFKRIFLIDNVKNTVLTSISNDFSATLSSKKLNETMNYLRQKLEEIIQSDSELNTEKTFSNKDEFESYILDKANQLKVSLTAVLQENTE